MDALCYKKIPFLYLYSVFFDFFFIFEKYSYLTACQKRNLDRLLPLQENIHLEECL